PCAVAVETGAAMARVPEIEQHIAGTRVESAHLALRFTTHFTFRRQVRDVGDAADIDDRPVMTAPEERGVKSGHQRRTLPAGGDVAAPEIGDDGHAGPLGDARRVI